MQKLTPLRVTKEKNPGRYSDGGGLYLQVVRAKTGEGEPGRLSKSWLFRYRLNGHLSRNGRPMSREMGLGSVETFGLGEARERARQARQLVADGFDPIAIRDQRKAVAQADAAKLVTFREVAEAYIAKPKRAWRNEKHRKQWSATLEAYAYPVIGHLPVGVVDEAHVLRILEPIWHQKTETASRLRGRIETVLDAAKVRKLRTGENPARWSGNLELALGKPRDVRQVRNHSAMPYVEIAGFLRVLREQDGVGPRALEFLLSTVARTGEALGALRSEIDLKAKIWTIPAARMKGKRPHVVPLTDRAVEIAAAFMPDGAPDGPLFPGAKSGKGLSNMALLAVLERMNLGQFTVHGFRSTFKDWARDLTDFPRELSEAALAHVIADKTEAAYARSTMFEKRRRMMEAWQAFMEGRPAVDNVVPISERAAS